MSPIIILPGIGDSGPSHWQSLWQARDATMRRFAPGDWDAPDLADWIDALDRAVGEVDAPPLLVAHSLSCLLIAHWAARPHAPVAGAFLVAVPDAQGQAFPAPASSFANPPRARLPFPALVVASGDDPYASTAYSANLAAAWGAEWVLAGDLGHINGASGIGGWPQGRALLEGFAARLG
jgi:hypothetical protein